MIKRIVFPLIVTISFLAVFVAPALAYPPDKNVDQFSYGPDMYIDCSDYGEYDFEIWNYGNVTMTEHVFYNPDGSISRYMYNFKGEDTLYNSASGKLVTGNAALTELDYPGDESKQILHGLVWHMTYPGMGVVLMCAGTIGRVDGEVVFTAGPKMPLNGEFGKLCAALSE